MGVKLSQTQSGNKLIVFRKRQNVYYVKVQERLSSLDAEEDYMMTVTSICGPKQASEEVPIHSKYFSPTEEVWYQIPIYISILFLERNHH